MAILDAPLLLSGSFFIHPDLTACCLRKSVMIALRTVSSVALSMAVGYNESESC